MRKFFVSLSIETFKLFLNVRGAGSKLTEKQSAKKFRPRWPSFSAVGKVTKVKSCPKHATL